MKVNKEGWKQYRITKKISTRLRTTTADIQQIYKTFYWE